MLWVECNDCDSFHSIQVYPVRSMIQERFMDAYCMYAYTHRRIHQKKNPKKRRKRLRNLLKSLRCVCWGVSVCVCVCVCVCARARACVCVCVCQILKLVHGNLYVNIYRHSMDKQKLVLY